MTTMELWESTVGFENMGVVHLNDSARALGSRRDRHAHIGQGEIGEDAFRLLLQDRRLKGKPGILETPKADDVTEDAMNLATLRRLMCESADPVE
jgi:deoxyribonuclease-4